MNEGTIYEKRTLMNMNNMKINARVQPIKIKPLIFNTAKEDNKYK
jgi:hypothetical protein